MSCMVFHGYLDFFKDVRMGEGKIFLDKNQVCLETSQNTHSKCTLSFSCMSRYARLGFTELHSLSINEYLNGTNNS